MAKAKSRVGHSKAGSRIAGVLFGLIFAGAGCAVIWFMGLGPYLKSQQAQDWIAVPCEITHSEVTSSTSDGSTTYGVDIRFAYEVDGRRYQSDDFRFAQVMTSGRTDKQVTVDAHPVGHHTTCWVDPKDPEQAVVDREPGGAMWWGLFGLPFALIGFGVIWVTVRGPRLRTRAFSAGAPRKNPFRRTADPVAADRALAGSDGVLDPGSTPLGKLIGMLFFATFWNGIVGTMLYFVVIKDGFDGGIDWVPMIFLSIFGLIGAGLLLIGVPYQFLSLLNPRPELRVEDGPLRIGHRARLEWETTGRHDRLTSFTIELIGREVARYRRGTNTYTSRHDFHRSRLYESIDPADVLVGRCELDLPTGLVPSFDGGNNKIEWALEVRGDIPTWPDLKLDFPLQIAPAEAQP